MAYKYATGSVFRGDIYNEDDAQGNTYIDWNEDAFGVVAGGTTNFVVSSSTVGIGTTSPTHEFEVHPDEDITAIIGCAFVGHSFNNDAATFGHYDRQGSHYAIYQNSSGLTILNTGASQAMYFRINNSNKAILDSNGQFGIGTTSAQSLLHVSGSGGILFQVDEASGSMEDAILFVTSSGEACRFGVGTSTPSSTLQVSGSRAANLTSFSTDTNLDETHCIVTFTGDTGVTGNLPAVDKCTGRIYHFFNQLDQGSNPLVIDGGSANVGTDGTTLAINPDEGNSSVSIVSNGSQWMIFGLYQQSEGGE